MSFTLLSVIIFGIMALVIYSQTTKWHKRGFFQSFINLSVSIVCAFLGALLSAGLGALVVDPINAAFKGSDIYGYIEAFAGDISVVSGFIIQIVLSLIFYIPLFFVLRIIVLLFIKTLIKKYSKVRFEDMRYLSENESFLVKNDKKIAAILGAATGFVLCVVMFMPFVGVMRTIPDAISLTNKVIRVEAIEESDSFSLLDKYSSDFSVNLLYSCGGGAVYDIATTVTIDDEVTSVPREMNIIRNVNLDATEGIFEKSLAIDNKKINEIEEAISEIDESAFLRCFSTQMIRNTSKRWLINKNYAGLKRPSAGNNENLKNIVDGILKGLSKTTVATYDKDVIDALSIISVSYEYSNILNNTDYTTLSNEIDKTGFLESVNDVIKGNPRMSGVNDVIDTILLKSLAKEVMNADKYSDFAREVLYSDLAMALNRTQGLSETSRQSTMSIYSSESFTKFGISLNNSLNRKFTLHILEYFPIEDVEEELETEEAEEDESLDGSTEETEKAITVDDVKAFFDKCLKGVK